MKKILYLVALLLIPAFSGSPVSSAESEDEFARLRKRMVERQIAARGLKDPRVLKAMETVPRHLFVPKQHRDASYNDYPLPIGQGQTISQPYVVAFMTEALQLHPEHRVLEIGTGSGYQAAILGELVKEVYTIEIIKELGQRAEQTLEKLDYRNVYVRIGDGYKGWPEEAPFDAIIVTCAPDNIPSPLIRQLKEDGRMIIPVGRVGTVQQLVRGIKKNGRLKREELLAVRFVPMTRSR